MSMDLTVNRLVAWAMILEKTLHGDGPWTFRTSAGTTPAHRLIDREKEEILFIGQVVPAADGMVELWQGEELVTLTRADFELGQSITWRLRPHLTITA